MLAMTASLRNCQEMLITSQADNNSLRQQNLCLQESLSSLTQEHRILRNRWEELEREKKALEEQVATLVLQNITLERDLLTHQQDTREATKERNTNSFSFESVQLSPIKGLMNFYTGFCHITLLAIFNFLMDGQDKVPFRRRNVKKFKSSLTPLDQFFLVLCRLRNGFEFKDLAFRFNIKPGLACTIFKGWMDHMSWILVTLAK